MVDSWCYLKCKHCTWNIQFGHMRHYQTKSVAFLPISNIRKMDAIFILVICPFPIYLVFFSCIHMFIQVFEYRASSTECRKCVRWQNNSLIITIAIFGTLASQAKPWQFFIIIIQFNSQEFPLFSPKNWTLLRIAC